MNALLAAYTGTCAGLAWASHTWIQVGCKHRACLHSARSTPHPAPPSPPISLHVAIVHKSVLGVAALLSACEKFKQHGCVL